MDYLYITIIIMLIIYSIKNLRETKKLPNDYAYNIYQNSRYYRLLILVIACVIGIVIFLIQKIFY